jgi:uncharacterized protein (TIGR02001 family)
MTCRRRSRGEGGRWWTAAPTPPLTSADSWRSCASTPPPSLPWSWSPAAAWAAGSTLARAWRRPRPAPAAARWPETPAAHPARAASPALGLLVAAALAFATPALAQVSGSLLVASDGRFRGRSISQGRPIATLDLAYDAASGAYAGLAGTGAATAEGPRGLALQAYAGFARRLAQGPSLDLGVSHIEYSDYYSPAGRTHLDEAYVGLIGRRLSGRLSYSPDYFGLGAPSLYGELEGALPAASNLRLSLHAGVLQFLGAPRFAQIRRLQHDWRVGVATSVRSAELELAWSESGPSGPRRRGWVVSLTQAF